MKNQDKITGSVYAEMLRGGTEVLNIHSKEVNDLNVFPIPDGDTGENMLLTIKGGTQSEASDDLAATAKSIADGMLLSARGNSGVILSQFFDGISHGFEDVHEADVNCLERAFRKGVEYAYHAVINPTEGTILTVIREATECACARHASTPGEFIDAFLDEAKQSLRRTPELLPVLKKAGVVDSGGAGIVYIAEGMKRVLEGEEFSSSEKTSAPSPVLDYSAFDENSTLDFGYCTELLIRLQNAKTDISNFDKNDFSDKLESLGDSVVTVVRGSIVKVHVHTKKPSEILEFCQRYGEFLNVKIENMSLQHNSLSDELSDEDEVTVPEREIATVAVASGIGIINAFKEMGADEVIDGGHSLNPSADDFLHAFKKANARSVIVFPNNSNSILTARQAAELWGHGGIYIIDSKNVGEGYVALSMLDTDSLGIDEAVAACEEAICAASVAEISRCVRCTEMDGFTLSDKDYISVIDKKIAAASKSRQKTVEDTLDKLSLEDKSIAILIRGNDLPEAESDEITKSLSNKYPHIEYYVINGGQDVYDCILVVQ